MSYTHYADTLITLMLGWIRAFTDWVWSIVRLGDGSAGKSFLNWFGKNWIAVVALLLAIGLAADWLIWLVRWKPYWLWFGKKRRILEDAGESPAPKPRRKPRPEAAEPASRRRPTQPRYVSKALPRKGEAPSFSEPDFEGDDLFDVVSGEATEPPESVDRKPSRSEGWIGAYVSRDSAQAKRAGKEKADEIDWFDS